MNKTIIFLIKLIISIIFLQTLWFKFSSHEDSVYIFNKMHLEPFGRYILGVIELIFSLLLLVKRYSFYSAIILFIIILGAIFSHIFILGIEINNDSGSLFYTAITTSLLLSTIIIYEFVIKKTKTITK